jgi:spore maturation protein CgeB
MASTRESIVKRRKIAFLGTLYPDYIQRFYRNRPGLDHRGFADQETELARDHFSWSYSFPEALREIGYDAINCLANVRPLQTRWAKENGHSWSQGGWMMDIAIAQLSAFEPEILYVNDVFTFKPEHIDEIRSRVPSIRTLICFVGIAVERREMLPDCDLLLTCATWNREKLQDFGFRTELQRHAFQPKIFSTLLATHRNTENRDIDASFVGSLIPNFHTQRFDSIRMLCRKTPLKIWTHSIERNWLRLARSGLRALIRGQLKDYAYHTLNLPVRSRVMGKAYGMELFEIFSRSKIAFNTHVLDSGPDAGNQRMFEATGAGACLLTDWRERIGDIFEPDKEVVTYKTPEEAVDKLNWLLANPDERETIARAGQARTLRDHTFTQRAREIDHWISTLVEERR